jgi:hypothetical protein
LEDLFMHDSRSRRVTDVDVSARRASTLRGVAFVGATALAVVALIVALNTLRGPQEEVPLASASATGNASPAASATAVGSAPPGTSPSGVPASSQPVTVPGPDARHGFLAQSPNGIRTEVDARSLAQLPQVYTAAVSVDGKRVAMVRTSETSQQLVTFNTGQPQQMTVALDFAGTGEGAGAIAWAADNSASVLIAVHKFRVGEATEYTTLRVVDLATKNVTEIARFTDGRFLVPLYWDPATRSAAAYETGPGGFGVDYVLVRGATVTRANFPFEATSAFIKADARTGRVLAIVGREGSAVSTWRYDRFDQRSELRPAAGDVVKLAFWRPNSEEVVVGVGTPLAARDPSTRIEVWSMANARRPLADGGTSAPLLVRVDGTAVLNGDFTLVDLDSGRAIGKVPRADPVEQPYLPVLF